MMTSPAAPSRPLSPARLAIALVLTALAICGAHLLDRAAFLHLHNPDLANRDWNRLLRVAGYVPTWCLVAAAFFCIDSASRTFIPPIRDRFSRAALLISSVCIAGLAAELLKLVVRRERPSLPDAAYHFRRFAESTWSTSGLGMPSSHAAVAGAACAILTLLYPRAWPVFGVIAAGCATTRILARAHYCSDTVAGLALGACAALLVWSLHTRALRRATPEAGGP